MRNVDPGGFAPAGRARGTPPAIEPWRSAITDADGEHLHVRGVAVTPLMRDATFSTVVGLLMNGYLPDEGERRILDAILIAIADHGAGAPSAAAARVVATGNRQAPEAAIAAGILAIGDAHGGAGLACFELIATALERGRREGLATGDLASTVVREARQAGRRLPGFGHRLYREEPRSVMLLSIADGVGKSQDGVALVRAIEKTFAASEKPVPLNVDGAIAGILFDLGYPALAAKLIFIVGRTAGLAAHVIEEYTRERPMRIRIPVVYDGPPSLNE
jgi:citrate synthase